VSSDAPKKRRRGAPLGNTNALVHGFYAKKLPHTDLSDIEGHTFSGLKEEIQILRLLLRRFVERFNAFTEPYDTLAFMRVACLAVISLSRLLHTERVLGDGSGDIFSIALSEVCKELGFEPDAPPQPYIEDQQEEELN